jgi:hypothetical protein
MIHYITDAEDRFQLVILWRTFFPDVPIPKDMDFREVTIELYSLVNATLFPLEWQAIDVWYEVDEQDNYHPFHYTIDYESGGVPWEALGLHELSYHLQPLFATVAPLLVPDNGWDSIYIRQAADWLNKWDFQLEVGLPQDTGLAKLRKALAAQPSPFNGLATLLDMLTRNSGNPFIDALPGGWRMEYDYHSEWEFYWNVEGLRQLTDFYKKARPLIDNTHDYYQWYNHTQDSRFQVTQLLIKLMRGNWHMEGQDIVWHNPLQPTLWTLEQFNNG